MPVKVKSGSKGEYEHDTEAEATTHGKATQFVEHGTETEVGLRCRIIRGRIGGEFDGLFSPVVCSRFPRVPLGAVWQQ